MTLRIIGAGPLAEQARRLADAAGLAVVSSDADYTLPATEDDGTLKALAGENVLFDAAAWAIASSRLKSDALLREHGIPAPAYFPGGSEPYIVKPDRGGFGLGIWVTDDYCEVGGAVNAGFVTQEELSGDVWSVAVTGTPGGYTAHPAARLTFDDGRHRTDAVCEPAPEAELLAKTAIDAAEAVGVHGVLEVEAIFDGGVWKVIDLNARLPMLTGDALLAAHGVNLLTELIRVYEG